jgi:hypothetical protein
MWPWQQFNWGVFWALIAALVIADLCKSAIGIILERFNE